MQRQVRTTPRKRPSQARSRATVDTVLQAIQRTLGNGGEVACAVFGVIVVLVAGSIWRRRRQQQAEHAALPGAGEAAQPIDRP